MRVTYLILTYNRIDTLKQHLDLLLKQTWPHWFEVIICDDGSTDGTIEFLTQLKDTHKYIVKWFTTGSINENTAAKARNNGIRAAQGEMIVMADDDCLPHKQLIESFANNYNPMEIQLGHKSKNQKFLDMELPVPIEKGNPQIWYEAWKEDRFIFFQTGSCAMSVIAARTPAKDGSIGLDERFVGYGHEDSELGYRLHGNGYKLTFNPDAVSWHMSPNACPQQDSEEKKAGIIKSRALLRKISKEPMP
jgi:chondroitin synthase